MQPGQPAPVVKQELAQAVADLAAAILKLERAGEFEDEVRARLQWVVAQYRRR